MLVNFGTRGQLLFEKCFDLVTCNYKIYFLVSLQLEFGTKNLLVNCDKITLSRDKIWIPNSVWMCLYRTKIQIDEIFRTIWESSGDVVPFTR